MINSNLYKPTDFFAVARNEAEVDNLLNNDIYKFLMLDFILANDKYKDINVKWKMKIRSKDVRTTDVIPLEALKEQLEAARQIQWVEEADLSFLRWMKWPTLKVLFSENTLEFLKDFRLPDFHVADNGQWNYEMEFEGPWKTSMMWEILGLKIINTLYIYHYIKKQKLTKVEFNQIINEMFSRLFQDVAKFQAEPSVKFSEFWTRRSMSTDWQRVVNEILNEKIPGQYLGTSNVMIAKELGTNDPKGTNAHELRMIPTALYDDPQEIIDTMYQVDREWMNHFPGLSVLLPDTYGTSFYLKNCPQDIIDGHDGNRFDSKDPMEAIPEYIDWLIKNWKDPTTKMWIPSDGLNSDLAVSITKVFADKMPKLSYGIGTNFTNNSKGTFPKKVLDEGPFGSFSVVIKPVEVQRPDGTWVSTVKLSDNPNKAMWEEKRVEKFKKIFGVDGMQEQDVTV